MSRTPLALAAAGLLALASTPTDADAQVMRGAVHDYQVVTVAEGLVHPWGIAFLPDGAMLVTERDGNLRVVRDGVLSPSPVSGVPE